MVAPPSSDQWTLKWGWYFPSGVSAWTHSATSISGGQVSTGYGRSQNAGHKPGAFVDRRMRASMNDPLRTVRPVEVWTYDAVYG